MAYIGEKDIMLEIARGNISGMSHINKFGRNIRIDATALADVWDGGHTGDESLIWVAPTQARTHTIASDNANDTSGGTGARTIRIYGLTAWDSAEVSEDVTMNTASAPVTSNAYVIIHRMKVLTKGATNVNIGTITATATTDGTVTAKLRASQGQTQMAIYGIPSNQTAYMQLFYASVNKAGGATGLLDVSLCVNPEPQVELLNFLTKHTFGLQTVGTSVYTVNYRPPKSIPGPAIVKVQVLSGTNNMDVSAGFDIVLADN